MLQDFFNRTSNLMASYLPSLLGALVILVAGWLLALVAAAVVRGVLRRTSVDNRVAGWMFGDRAIQIPIERFCGTAVFWLVMLFVLMAFFEALQLTAVTQPLNALLEQVTAFAPRVLGALLLFIVAGVVASLVRQVVGAGLVAARADERLGSAEGQPVTTSVREAVYWTVWLLFLPMILSTLELTGLIEPVQALLNKALAFLPNLLAAGVALAIGWFIAHLVRRIVTNLLAAVGVDRLGQQFGAERALGPTSVSAAVGTIVYVLILLPVGIAALNALQIEAVTAPASNMLDTLLNAVPAMFAAALVLVLSYIVGRLVAELVSRTLATIGFNRALAAVGVATPPEGANGRAPSTMAGHLVLAAIMLFAAIEAAGLLGFTELQTLLSSFLTLAGHVLLGLTVFGIGLYLANLASRAIHGSGTANADVLAEAARVAIIVLTGAMALRQMGLANEIVNLAFGLTVGAIAVAIAIAFGLGARDIAGRQVEEWVQRYRSARPGTATERTDTR